MNHQVCARDCDKRNKRAEITVQVVRWTMDQPFMVQHVSHFFRGGSFSVVGDLHENSRKDICFCLNGTHDVGNDCQ